MRLRMLCLRRWINEFVEMGALDLESALVMKRSREGALMFALFSSFETSRHTAVMVKSSFGFGISMARTRGTFGKLPEAVSDEEEERAHNLATFIPGLVAD